ncbi:BlaI/MecI/CopY family transcriptional regulator [Kitasatospora cineracea]|uniref:Transcriptional regulator n=1 Tax=Kitasatospora cineracea TaxID=88074 RepID=A0A3N4R5B3_9ACTN|nr:BlaI/MecI/CopY family transcriptional regulator [Kitasatospora cineracea]ROR37855.1 putative transcriptional regulator [Kitasatospora cineracea]RPE28723.1 putative transcriptional regulator [Kitasatospora cineracea]
MRRLGDLEAEIMDRLWTWDRPATVREIVDDLNRTRPLAYTTVMTVADILHRKGLLRREKSGRAWSYRPACSREAYSAALMRDVLGESPNPTGALAHLVEQLTPEELAALRTAIDSVDTTDRDPRRPGADPR